LILDEFMALLKQTELFWCECDKSEPTIWRRRNSSIWV
jgi:hypothetical protein